MKLTLNYRQFEALKRLMEIHDAVDKIAIADGRVETFIKEQQGKIEWKPGGDIELEIPD